LETKALRVLARGYSRCEFACVAPLEAATLHNSRVCLQLYITDNLARSGHVMGKRAWF
jgi:hypothetical protein